MTTAVLLLLAVSCGDLDNNDSDVKKRISSSTDAASVEKALNAKVAFRVNLSTNRTTYYVDGVATDQWNIATGDVSGFVHGGEKKFTPTGIFTVDRFAYCPMWRPSKVTDPKTGKKTTDNAVRQKVFQDNPSVYGSCGKRNPLGRYMISFTGPYYMHGNSNESVLNRADPENRRVSGGCVRNPNAIIQKYFHKVLEEFPSLKDYSLETKKMEKDGNLNYTRRYVDDESIRVVIGYLGKDPAISSSVGDSSGEQKDNSEASKPAESSVVPASSLGKVSVASILDSSVPFDGNKRANLDGIIALTDGGQVFDKLEKSELSIVAMHMDQGKTNDLGVFRSQISAVSPTNGQAKLNPSLATKLEELSSGKVYLKMEMIQNTNDGKSHKSFLPVTDKDKKKYFAFFYDVKTGKLSLK